MTRQQLQTVLSMASYEVDAKAADNDIDYAECKAAYEAVKAFWGNPRSSWMVPAARGVDAVKVFPEGYDRN